ncbi:MAG: GNAT family N-acetyltransferase [Gemmatimonadota bacterium]
MDVVPSRSLLVRGARLLRRALDWAHSTRRILVYRIEFDPTTSTALPADDHGIRFELDAPIREAGTNVPPTLRAMVAYIQPELRVHVLRDGSAIIGWGMSGRPARAWPITETGTLLHVVAGECVLAAFEVVTAFRGQGLYKRMLTELLRLHATEGDTAAWIWCYEDNLPSRKAIERLQFVHVQTHEQRRRFGKAQSEVHDVRGSAGGT